MQERANEYVDSTSKRTGSETRDNKTNQTAKSNTQRPANEEDAQEPSKKTNRMPNIPDECMHGSINSHDQPSATKDCSRVTTNTGGGSIGQIGKPTNITNQQTNEQPIDRQANKQGRAGRHVYKRKRNKSLCFTLGSISRTHRHLPSQLWENDSVHCNTHEHINQDVEAIPELTACDINQHSFLACTFFERGSNSFPAPCTPSQQLLTITRRGWTGGVYATF